MRRVLVVLLALGMAVLSFDALRAYALTGRPLTDGVIPQATILPRPWLAMLWAVVVDLAVAAGILGVKDDRRDPCAWAMLLLALAATLGFQVFALSPFVARAVPPVGLALAILVLDLGPARPKAAQAAGPPLPARAHAWLRSWELDTETAGSVPASTFGRGEDPGPAGPVPGSRERQPVAPARPNPARPGGLTLAQRRRVEGWVAEGQRNKSEIAKRLGLSDRKRKELVGPLVDELLAQVGPGNNGQGSMRE